MLSELPTGSVGIRTNVLRGLLCEFGHVIPQGIGHLKKVEAIIDEPACDLPALVRDECRDLLAQITEKTVRIDDRTKLAKVKAEETDTARPFQTLVTGSGLARMKCSGGAFQPEQGPEGRAWGH